MKHLFLTLCMISLLCFHASAQENTSAGTSKAESTPRDTGAIFLQWERIEAARGYRIEIVDPQGRKVIEKTTERESVRFTIPNGNYRFRVGVLNVFRRVELWTDWSPLVVKNPVIPEFTSLSTTRGYREWC